MTSLHMHWKTTIITSMLTLPRGLVTILTRPSLFNPSSGCWQRFSSTSRTSWPRRMASPPFPLCFVKPGLGFLRAKESLHACFVSHPCLPVFPVTSRRTAICEGRQVGLRGIAGLVAGGLMQVHMHFVLLIFLDTFYVFISKLKFHFASLFSILRWIVKYSQAMRCGFLRQPCRRCS